MNTLVVCLLLMIAFAMEASSGVKRLIPIVMSTDDKYVYPTVVALTSMFENANMSTIYQVYVLVPNNMKPETRKILFEAKKERYEGNISIIDMGGEQSLHQHGPKYYRLAVAGILMNWNKCIYLDGDTIVRHDLSEMYDINGDDFVVAGVRVPGPFHHQECRELGIPDLKHYICTGAMIMNLEKIRHMGLERIFERMLDEKRKVFDRFWADQSVINLVCYGKLLCLPDTFGVLINQWKYYRVNWQTKDPTIVHFGGMQKPWKYTKNTVFHREFWKYAAKAELTDGKRKVLQRKKDFPKGKKNQRTGGNKRKKN